MHWRSGASTSILVVLNVLAAADVKDGFAGLNASLNQMLPLFHTFLFPWTLLPGTEVSALIYAPML